MKKTGPVLSEERKAQIKLRREQCAHVRALLVDAAERLSKEPDVTAEDAQALAAVAMAFAEVQKLMW